MGYWPNKVKRRRHSWVNHTAMKLVLMGFEGSHQWGWRGQPNYHNRPHSTTRRCKVYFIERGNEGSEMGFSTGAALLRMARRMEII